METKKEVVHTRTWEEESEPDNPFAAARCYCRGYDVYGDLLGKISWVEYLLLLFQGERPQSWQTRLLEGLAIIVANPGPRDHSVRAAMNGGAGGSTSAACLMAALAAGAGQLGGAREIMHAVKCWQSCGQDISAWQQHLSDPDCDEDVDVWPVKEHPPGFDPNGVSCTTPVRQSLAYLAGVSEGPVLPWLQENRVALEEIARHPLAMTGVAAAGFVDAGFDAEQSEMLFLLLRLPGAAVHALEQKHYGWRKYPFFGEALKLQEPAVQ